jgi:hypothetical protein
VSSIGAVAERNGVTVTPTMLINGEPVDLTKLTPEALQTMITSAAQK